MENKNLKYEQLLLKKVNTEESEYTGFLTLEPTYTWSNENLFLYSKDDFTNKNILSVTASGDQIINVILNNGTKIDAFDINLYSRYFVALKIAMIKTYSYETFWKLMINFTSNGNLEFNYKNSVIDEVSKFLTDDEYDFWKCYQSLLNQEKIEANDILNIYLNDNYKKNPYYNYNNYIILKKKISNASINFIDSDIANLNKVVDKKYDALFTSNIFDYVLPCDSKSYINRFQDMMKNLDKLLNEASKLYGYSFDKKTWFDKKVPYGLRYSYGEISSKERCFEGKSFTFTKLK